MTKPRPARYTCPTCGQRWEYENACLNCHKEGVTLTGAQAAQAIEEFMVWYRANPSAWERAQKGLMMGVPRDCKTAMWP
jgi:hypothetical protein